MENKRFIISLIVSDVRKNKLSTGLQAIGLTTKDYYLLDLNDNIFELIGFDISDNKSREKLPEKYLTIIDSSSEQDILEIDINKIREVMAEYIYSELVKYKSEFIPV